MEIKKTDAKRPKRTNSPERTKSEILNAATEEFSLRGLDGARVDVIAARTKNAKRMIYYYFGNKEGLYLAVLERAYGLIRAAEKGLNLKGLSPSEAITRLVEFTFDYQEASVDFVRLVANENIHFGDFIKKSNIIGDVNAPVLQELSDILKRGQSQGAFRADIEPLDVHLLISSFCFFRVSNQHTLQSIFRTDLFSPEIKSRHKAMLVDAVLGYLQTGLRNGAADTAAAPPRVRAKSR